MAAWINEFHYDNSTANDPGEFIEIAATVGTDLTGWSIVLYNGGGTPTGQSYSTRSLTGLTLSNVTNGIGFVSLSYSNTVQNGSPDGIALVDNNNNVVQFLSYEGTMTASNGPASGMTSTDVGVAETNATAPGSSLGLIGTGDEYSDFTWAVRTDDTPGSANVGQTFTAAGPVTPSLSINDVSQDENTGTFTFTVTLSSAAPAGGVKFDLATADGTAFAASDYTSSQVTGVVIPEGQSTYQFQVQVTGDADLEPNETFFVNVTNVVGATVTDGQGQGTIVNDDSPGAISVADVTIGEGDSGTTPGAFTLTRSGGSAGTVTVDYTITLPGGAGGADSSDVSATLTGTVTFLAGETSATIPFTVNGDVTNEPNETFTVALSNPTGGATISDGSATATITNDDAPPAATIADASIAEGAQGVSYLTFTVTLSKSAIDPVTIDYATAPGTAAAGSDFLSVSGQLSFAAGETVKTVTVPIVGDQVPEPSETFTVTLSNPTNATIADGSATGTIANDDGAAYYSLAAGTFSQDWSNTNQIVANDDWSGVPHIIGYLGNYTAEQPSGVDPRTLTAPSTLGEVDVLANQPNVSSTSGGVAEFQITNPTIGIQGSGTGDAPSIVLYMDASGRTDVRVQANLRDLDGSADNAAQQINVQYRTDPTGDWVNAPGGYFSDVTLQNSATQVTALDITLPADANNAPTLQIRIMTTNASGSDEWVGIDDIVVSSAQGAPSYSVSDAAVFEGTGGTTPIVFTVTRAGDATAAGTVAYQVTFAGGGFSADAGDFASPLSGTVAFAAGETSRTITLQVAADAIPEADEGFLVILSDPDAGTTGDSVGNGTIVNDDGTPPFVTIADVIQAEGNDGSTLFTFTVTRTGGTGAFTVDYATAANGTAAEGEDFEAASGTLTFGAGETSKNFTVQVNGDFASELAETFTVQLSNPTGNAVIADPSATGTIQNDDVLLISQVQGSAYYSPVLAMEGTTSFNTASVTTVVIRAVVTAIDNDGTRQGFYLTEEKDDWDLSMLTSEGIFVMSRNDANVGTEVAGIVPFGFAVGDVVTVSAQVMEYQAFQSMPRTVLVNPTGITIESKGNTLPKLVLDATVPIPNSILTLQTPDYTDSVDNVGDTFDASLYGLSFWETVEGMLVTIPDMVVADGFIESTSPTIFQAYSTVHADPDQINSRGGYTIAGDPPLSPPDTPENDDGTIAGGRHVHDGDINPDIIELDFSGFALDPPAGLREQVTMGDKIGTITGVVDFDFTDRKLFVTEWDSSQFVDTQPVRETTTLGADSRSLTVATFNVENLDPSDGQAKFDALADAIALNLNSPDILIIEEIQDNNGTGTGTNDASTTWQMLVDAVNARVPGARYQWVDEAPPINSEGGQGNGNIRVGFLYDTNRVQLGNLAADASIDDRRKWTDRIGDGMRDDDDLIAFSDDRVGAEINTADWTSTRKSLLAQFTFNGASVFLTANHFTAKLGSGDMWQFDQNIEGGQPVNEGWNRRIQQAEDVWHVLNLIQTTLPNAAVMAGGDFNDFYFYRPLEVLTGHVETDGTARVGGTRFANLTLTLPEAERYTYTFDGRSQAIDHIVATESLAAAATFDVVHLNTGYNGLVAANDPSISDHDPGVASFDFRSMGETVTGTTGNDTLQGFGGNDRLQGGEGADTIDGGDGSDTAVYSEEAPNGVVVNLSTFFVTVPNRPGAFRQVGPNEALDGFDNYETLVSIENAVSGDKDDRVYGSDGANRFETRGGNDLLIGGAGADVLIGGAGNDSYSVDDANDQVVENSGGGTDTVSTSLAVYVLGANVENLFTEGNFGLARDYRGNALDNEIRGSGASDVFRMQDGGDDIARGGAARDAFYFGAAFTAADSVYGNAGSDILILQGDYSAGVVLGGATAAGGHTGQVLSVESLSLFSGSIASYGDNSNATYRYNVTSRDENVEAGGQMRVNGFGLLAGENLTFDGRAETDGTFLMLGGRGIDTFFGGAGRDNFVFGHDGRFGIGDSVDGGEGYDVVYLRGDYQLDFTSIGGGTGTFANVESIGLLSATDTSFVSGGDGEFDYDIVWADAMLVGGRTMTVNGSRLGAAETMIFDGSKEMDGAFRVFAGSGADILTGGAGNDLIYGGLGGDTMRGGAGNDVFRYQSVEDSTGEARDGIQDFATGDVIDLSRIDVDGAVEGDQAFTFIGADAFSGTRGELRATKDDGPIWLVQADTDGNGVADLEFLVVVADQDPITATDFLL